MSILCKLGVPKMNPALVKYSTVRWPRDCPKFALAGGVDESEQSALLRRGPHRFAARDLALPHVPGTVPSKAEGTVAASP